MGLKLKPDEGFVLDSALEVWAAPKAELKAEPVFGFSVSDFIDPNAELGDLCAKAVPEAAVD